MRLEECEIRDTILRENEWNYVLKDQNEQLYLYMFLTITCACKLLKFVSNLSSICRIHALEVSRTFQRFQRDLEWQNSKYTIILL